MEFPLITEVIGETGTSAFVKEFAKEVLPGDIILFEGNLGAGKTFFIKSLAANFGIENASSPSFSIVNEYSGKLRFYHFDFYRIKKVYELYDIGIEEYLSDPDAVKLVEWAELFPEVFERIDYKVYIEIGDIDKRVIKIERYKN